MSKKSHGQIRRSQVITTYGPGALIDLPHDSAIVGGLEHWPGTGSLDAIQEPRLVRKIEAMTGTKGVKLYAPPVESNEPGTKQSGITVWKFPEWYVVQESGETEQKARSRRLVHQKALDGGKFQGRPVVPTRFVRACNKGHVDDIDWHHFVHRGATECRGRQLWLDETGTSGDLVDLVVRCECGMSRRLYEAAENIDSRPLRTCTGARPWLGKDCNEECNEPSRLLIRTASNAYFPQAFSVLSLPVRGSELEIQVKELWDELQYVEDEGDLRAIKKLIPHVAARLSQVQLEDAIVLKSICDVRAANIHERPVKEVELEAILAAPEGFGDDVPIDQNFHARRLPDRHWRKEECFSSIESVVQLHRLREVVALIGFTRLEAETPDINGEFDGDIQRAQLTLEPSWYPAVENRGEGIFLSLRGEVVSDWLKQPAVEERLAALAESHSRWFEERKRTREFPGGGYILLHTLSHMLMQAMATRCGYPASAIRERIYSDPEAGKYGVLLYTGSSDAEGTLGGLVQQAGEIQAHLKHALRMNLLCSNDPICSGHDPSNRLDGRPLHGAACHACVYVSETSCEMRNDYLDRSLVVPTLGLAKAAFFQQVP